jgi:fumarate hydratase class II
VIDDALPSLYPLAIGGTAVGTGLNTAAGFGARVARNSPAKAACRLSRRTTSSRRWRHTMAWSPRTARSGRWPWR